MTIKRCAIYTRTSSDEALGQEFNSLHAQSEACAAFVKSQAGEGWRLNGRVYEDGGFSGGSIERPALKQLMADIDAGRIDVIVVYKVDRLTRSLMDFAKIVERLDAAQASFCAVTQSFNSTTSMGRLTLNVLLSFAQFEREVTAERIRDKFAASKARGLWMGGNLPLGYDVKDRALVVNEAEAETVRHIFQRFLELKSVPALVADLDQAGIRSKQRQSSAGRRVGGARVGRAALYHMLGNALYRGLIPHKDKVHQGQHLPIVDEELWDAVQQLRAQSAQAIGAHHASGALLQGKLFDDAGVLMSPSHAQRGQRRYRYYVSSNLVRGKKSERGASLTRVSMPALDGAVIGETEPLLSAGWRPLDDLPTRVREALVRVTTSASQLTMLIQATAIAPEHRMRFAGNEGDTLRIECNVSLARPRNVTTVLHSNAAAPARLDRTLVRAIARAHAWAKSLEAGEYASVLALARAERLCVKHTTAILPLAYLAPDLVRLILDGRQPRTLTLAALTAKPLPLDWRGQRAYVASFA